MEMVLTVGGVHDVVHREVLIVDVSGDIDQGQYYQLIEVSFGGRYQVIGGSENWVHYIRGAGGSVVIKRGVGGRLEHHPLSWLLFVEYVDSKVGGGDYE